MVNQTVTGGPGTITGWDDPEERRRFYLRMLPTAQKWSARTGIPVAVYLAINAHESNFGKSDALFGIKGTGTRGSQNLATWEAGPNGERININDSFRAYNSDDEAYADFHNLISQGRYAPAWQRYQQDRDPIGLLNNIVAAGYATDKNWGNKIGQVANRFQQEMQQFGIDAGTPAAVGGRTSTVTVNRTPVQGQITQGFGNPFPMDSGATYQGTQYPHFNKGVDYGAAGGSPVTPTVGGTVVMAHDDGAGWGPRVVIRDAEGFDHSYGHLDPNSIRHLRPGMTVQNDVQIGVVASGAVGTSTGPHLSYDISKNGEPVDPSPWLGQNVRAPGIPAGQAPAYLGGQGMSMVNQSSAGSGFYEKEIGEAQWHINWAQQRLTEIREGKHGDPNSQENQNAVEDLNIRLAEEQERLQNAQAGLRTHQLTNPAATGANPVEAAAAAGTLRQNAFGNAFDVWKAMMDGLAMDATVKNALSTLLFNAQNANIANTDAWVKNQVALGNLTLDQAVAKVQAQAMASTAQAASNAEELARGQWIDEVTFRNFERRLPPGVTEVPGLGKNDALASATRNFGLQPTTLGVTPVDWDELRPERSLQRAGATMPPRIQFDTAGIDAVAPVIGAIQNPRPEQITPSSINLQAPPNVGALLTQPPQAPDYSDLIAQIMATTSGRVQAQLGGAPQPPATTPSAPRTTNPTNASLGPQATGFIEAEAAAAPNQPQPPSEAQVSRLLNPGQRVLENAALETEEERLQRVLGILKPETRFLKGKQRQFVGAV